MARSNGAAGSATAQAQTSGNPFEDDGNSSSSNPSAANETAPAIASGATVKSRGGRGAAGGRAGDPNAPQPKTYGDNPEARQQLAAAARSQKAPKSPSTAQKRDAGRQRWGGSNTGQIGFERKVPVQVMAEKIVIGDNDVEIVIEPGTTQEELVDAVLQGLDAHSQSWGQPPKRFYWVPYVNFDVYAGGTNNYQRLHDSLREWGVFSEAKYQQGDKAPTKPPKDGNIQQVSKSEGKQSKSAGDPKKIKPAESTPATPPDPAKKPTQSWFKRFTSTFGF
jgi:hypothetical protein